MTEYLRKLTSSISPSGYEGSVLNVYNDLVSQYVDCTQIDEIGNLIAYKNCKNPNAQTLLLVAHADEVGFVVKRIDEKGFVYVANVGGLHFDYLPGKVIVFPKENGFVYGVFGEKPIHMTLNENNNKTQLHISDLWVDIGCSSFDEANKKITIGDYGTYAPFFQIINDNFVISKALDNRVSMYVILKVLQEIESFNLNIVVAITVQEEIGRRGSMAIANRMNIKNCLVLDVTHATDYPTISNNRYGDIRLGKGVVIPIGANINSNIQKKLIDVACANNISFQRDVIPSDSRTDAAVMQNIGFNRYVGIVSVPVRYMHSSTEMASIKDVDYAIKLIHKYIDQF